MGRTYEWTPRLIAKERRIAELARIGRACRGDHGGILGCDKRSTHRIATTEANGRVIEPMPVCAGYARIVARSIAYYGPVNDGGQRMAVELWR